MIWYIIIGFIVSLLWIILNAVFLIKYKETNSAVWSLFIFVGIIAILFWPLHIIVIIPLISIIKNE